MSKPAVSPRCCARYLNQIMKLQTHRLHKPHKSLIAPGLQQLSEVLLAHDRMPDQVIQLKKFTFMYFGRLWSKLLTTGESLPRMISRWLLSVHSILSPFSLSNGFIHWPEKGPRIPGTKVINRNRSI